MFTNYSNSFKYFITYTKFPQLTVNNRIKMTMLTLEIVGIVSVVKMTTA